MKTTKQTADLPFSSQYFCPELDIREEFNNDQLQLYQILVGIMIWLCEIGRIDILTETFLILTYLLATGVGNLHQTLHVFKYLNDHT